MEHGQKILSRAAISKLTRTFIPEHLFQSGDYSAVYMAWFIFIFVVDTSNNYGRRSCLPTGLSCGCGYFGHHLHPCKI